jgi:hypothetical protein
MFMKTTACRKNRILALTGSAAGMLLAGSALAIDYTLSIPNAELSGFPGPFGTVNVTLTSPTTADVTFTALDQTSGGTTFDYFFIATGAAGVNVNSTSWSISNLANACTSIDCGPGPGALSDGGSGNEDGFGVFNQRVDQFDGFNNRSTEISFTLTDLSGTWSSDGVVLAANSLGNIVAAHVAVCDSTSISTCANGALSTGFVTNGNVIPETSTWVMMITGFALLGWAGYRKGRTSVSIVA